MSIVLFIKNINFIKQMSFFYNLHFSHAIYIIKEDKKGEI